MTSTNSAKAPLLPVSQPMLQTINTRDEHPQQRIEYTLMISAVLLTTIQFLILYGVDSTTPVSRDSLCDALLHQLARGLRISIPHSSPTTAILFIIAPYIAQPGRIVAARYAILVGHLVGSTLGALLV
ncbi:hypothetical protein BDW02DRAFT_574852 [Decorospora gaudefroyi]|uniref:Uncharacterized protein n=1 Tax=Decorospora gaudefroyi TaxID=184978 RepID=A0A6A5JVM5_9PLEO|nr:hypothetical protein BDW02DRAFT_574852 [Decorospora gaudefroyi]